MKSKVTVVIPTLNNIRGITYLRRYFKSKNYDLIIIDNSKKNRGFAAGVNYGAKKAKTKWLLILNDDIEFPTNVIDKLIAEATNKKFAAVSPLLRNPNGTIENYGYKILPYGKVELLSKSSKDKIDGLTAACLLIKTSVFKKLRGFDENFFAYLEDVDFFLRFKKSEYRMGISKLEVRHNHMTTTKTIGNFKARQDMVNWGCLFFNHKDKFVFDWKFIVERLRNVSGYVKATLKSLGTY